MDLITSSLFVIITRALKVASIKKPWKAAIVSLQFVKRAPQSPSKLKFKYKKV